MNGVPLAGEEGEVNNGGYTDTDNITDDEAKKEGDTTSVKADAANTQNDGFGGPSEEDAKGIDARALHSLKGQTEWMQGPPGDSIAQCHKHRCLCKTNGPNDYFGRVK